MRRCLASFCLGLAACAAQEDLSDVTGARGTREVNGSTYGAALPRVSAADQRRFEEGLVEFKRKRDVRSGLGPVMSGAACSECHDSPLAVGGANGRLERRFGRRNPDGSFDPLLSLGGPMLQDDAIGTVNGFNWKPETPPATANVVAQRRTTPVFGLGLVDSTPDASFVAVAEWQRVTHPEVAGRPAAVRDLVRNADAIGRFGWKASQPTLLQFTADAFVNEMGITNPLFPAENCPQGDCSALANNPAPGVNDPEGIALASATEFMRFLGPPPRSTAPPPRGPELFAEIGCAACHLQTLVTGPSASAALDRVAYHPFSDFLLHDMGTLGDRIDEGDAKGAEIRTPPLWGLPFQHRLLHDGRTTDVAEAILAHDGQGKPARDRFAALPDGDRASLLLFLESL